MDEDTREIDTYHAIGCALDLGFVPDARELAECPANEGERLATFLRKQGTFGPGRLATLDPEAVGIALRGECILDASVRSRRTAERSTL